MILLAWLLHAASVSASIVSDVEVSGTVGSFDAKTVQLLLETGVRVVVRRDAFGDDAEKLRPGKLATARLAAEEFYSLRFVAVRKESSRRKPASR